jgi:hypothetical protein
VAWASLEEALTLGTGIERSFPCPVHDDRNPSASVNSTTGYWYCYTCGAWGQADMDRLEFDPLSVHYTVRRIVERMEQAHQSYPEGWLSVFDAAGPGEYWLSRFGRPACEHFRLGQTADRDAATIPMRGDDGEVLGVIRRDLTGAGQKYKYPHGVDVTRHIFDLHRKDTETLIVTEGATDTVAAWEAGFPHGVALYGSRLSRTQAKLIKKYAPSRIICAQDQDQAGEAAYHHVRNMLGTFFPVVRAHWDEHKDLASIPLAQRVKMLSEMTREEPRFQVAEPEKTRVGSSSCGSSRRGTAQTGLTSSSSTRKLVVRRKRPSGSGP